MLTSRPTVVVGVDGTDAGVEALRVGLREASLRNCAVEVVTCWQPDTWYGTAIGADPDDSLARARVAQEDDAASAPAVISFPVIDRPHRDFARHLDHSQQIRVKMAEVVEERFT